LASPLELTALLLTLSALCGWINGLTFRMPRTIGLLLLGLFVAIALILAEIFFPQQTPYDEVARSLGELDFTGLVIDGMLAFILFAGALHTDFRALHSLRGPVAYLALVGPLLSTLIVGLSFWWLCQYMSLPVTLPWALVFGALICPTDPISILAILKSAGLPKRLQMELKGEAMFNDGVGIVLFTFLVGIASGHESPHVEQAALEMLWAAGGGLALGATTGYLAYRAMRAIDDFAVEVLITLALVTATYAIAERIGASGPISTVAAGLLVGSRASKDAMSEETENYVSALWTMIDQVLNSVLFLLIGLEVLIVAPAPENFVVAALAIPLVLLARVAAIGVPFLLPVRLDIKPRNMVFLSWAGIHGGISVALALAIPPGDAKPIILAATYAVVLFSLIVQALTLRPLAQWLNLSGANEERKKGASDPASRGSER